MRKILFSPVILLLIILSFSVFVSAETDYTTVGGGEEDFYSTTGASKWKSSLDYNYEVTPLTLGDGVGMPMVADLNGDGKKEIIVNNGGTIILYNYSKDTEVIDIISGGTMTLSVDGRYSNMEIFDFDEDGLLDVILADVEVAKELAFFEYNGTHLNKTDSVDLSGAGYTSGNQIMIKCPIAGECLVVSTGHIVNAHRVTMQQTDGSTVTNKTIPLRYVAPTNIALPHFGKISYENYNPIDINVNTYIFSYAGASTVFIDAYESNASGLYGHRSIQETDFNTPETQFEYMAFTFTSPLVVDSKTTSGLEWWVGMNVDGSNPDYRLFAYDAFSSNPIFYFPKLTQKDGYILGSPFIADAIEEESMFPDVCIMGYDSETQGQAAGTPALTVLCGSAFKNPTLYDLGALDHRSYELYAAGETAEIGNLTTGLGGVYNEMTHSFESMDNSQSEVIMSYGIFTLNKASCNVISICSLDPILNPFTEIDQAIIPVDWDDDGFDDMIGISESIIYFYNDKRTNNEARIDDIEICPSNKEGIWNTSSPFRIKAWVWDKDIEEEFGVADNISVRITVYANHINNQSTGWQNYSSATSTVTTLNGFANASVVSGEIVVEARDGGSGITVTKYDYFTASPAGNVFYDEVECYHLTDHLIPEPDPEVYCTTDDDCEDGESCYEDGICGDIDLDPNNPIKDALQDVSGGVSVATMFLILLFVVGFTFITGSGNLSPAVLIAGIVLLIFGGVMIGVKTQILGSGSIIILVILSIILITLFTLIFKAGSGGD